MSGSQLVPTTSPGTLARFAQWGQLSVKQRKRWLEILFSWEAKNTYDVFDGRDVPVLRVEEQGSGFLNLLKRLLLGPYRPFEAHVLDAGTRGVAMQVRRPFRWIFHEVQVTDASGVLLGSIVKRWSWVRRIYTVLDAQGRELATLFGPLLRPWTFEIQVNGQELGLLQKKWSGLGKEMFTDADNFRLEMERIGDPGLRALVFAATMLVDVVHFERKKG